MSFFVYMFKYNDNKIQKSWQNVEKKNLNVQYIALRTL